MVVGRQRFTFTTSPLCGLTRIQGLGTKPSGKPTPVSAYEASLSTRHRCAFATQHHPT